MSALPNTPSTAATLRASFTAEPAAAPARKALRFLTAGSVDDGKSTLIGRLLFESQAILADQLDNLHQRAAGQPIDLSLLTDGLEAEREQGITIDVAYRYFATPKRKFIIADAPGHEQYTRNMVTAAAGSDAAVVLVDITKLDCTANAVQLLPQTRRHALLAQLLRVPSIVFAVNKLDAVADPGQAFGAVAQALQAFAAEAGIAHAGIVPVSALRGDNVTLPLAASWYQGPTLLQLLEGLPTLEEASGLAFSLPVQYVARSSTTVGSGVGEQPRVLWGRIAQGQVAVGDLVQVFPSGEKARVAALKRAGTTVEQAHAGQSTGVVLDRQLDVSRGNWLALPGELQAAQRFRATLAWLDVEAATPGRKYWLRHGNQWVQGRLSRVLGRLDIHNLVPSPAEQLGVNDIGEVEIELQQELPLSTFAANRVGGALIVVDPTSHRTSGALLVQHLAAAA
jgi:sulfate adenylyltransferase subunit 1